MNRRIRWVAVFATAALALTSCSSATPVDYSYVAVDQNPQFPTGSTMQKLSDKQSIRIGAALDKPHFGVRGLNGEMQGFDIEMARIIAGKLGIAPDDIEFVETTSSNREPFIDQGKVDIVIATYTINDERKQVVSFAGPYLTAGQALLIGDNSPDDITDIDSAAGHEVCSVTGSTGYENIRENYPDVKIVGFDTYSKCGDALENGQVDAVTADNTTLTGLISDHQKQGFDIAGPRFSEEPYGIGLSHNDRQFRLWLDDILQESFDNGEWEDAWDRTAGKILDETPTPPEIQRY